MRKAMEYVKSNKNLEAAIEQIKSDTVEAIYNWIEDMNEYDAFDFVSSFNDYIHRMDDLDDVFCYMGATEVLEELSNIDLGEDFFNEDTKESGDNVWYVADESMNDAAERLHDGDLEWDDWKLEEIFDEERELIAEVTKRFKVFDQAKALFDKMMAENPEEVLTILWNSQN